MFIPLLIYPLPSTATGISSIPYILNKLIFRIPLSELLEFRKLLAITKKERCQSFGQKLILS